MKITRYFSFSRINPRIEDYDKLLETCDRIDAAWGFKVAHDIGKVRMTGYIILRGNRTFVADLEQLFPNFLLTRSGDHHHFDWAADGFTFNVTNDGGPSDITVTAGEHPFSSVCTTLFK